MLLHMKQCVSVVSIKVLPPLRPIPFAKSGPNLLGFPGPAELEETQFDIPEDLQQGEIRIQVLQVISIYSNTP